METRIELSRGQILATMAGLSLGVLMSALDLTIVSTAMPGIVRDLSGLARYSWPFTAYLICSTVATMVFGKLSDSWGRRRVFLGGLAWFIATSALCGLAKNMGSFIVFRGLQGAGGGVIISTAFAVVGEAFPRRESGKYMGIIGGMFGLASIVGPLAGGFITDNLGWRWVFFINLPLGVAAFAVLALGLAGHIEAKSRSRLDLAGIALFVLSTVPLLLGLSLGGKSYAWDSLQIMGLFALALIAGVALVLVELRAESPLIPIAFFKDRDYTVSAIGSFLSNAVFFAGILLIPLYLQRVLKSSATGSGLAITPLMLAYTLASVVGGQLVSRRGKYRGLAILCGIVTLAGVVPLCALEPTLGRAPVMIAMILLGLGLGALTPVFQIAAQNRAEPRQIGTVTSSVIFFRNLGSTVGSAIFGAAMSGSLSAMLARFDWGQTPERVKAALGNPQILMNGAAVDQIVAGVPAQYRAPVIALVGRLDQGLAGALSAAFWAALAFAAAALIACLAFERGARIRR